MLVDDLFDRLVRRLKRSGRKESSEPLPSLNGTRMGSRSLNGNRHGSGIFNNASNFVANQPVFIEQIIQSFVAPNPEHHLVLEHIAQYADLDAAMDSSARFPPPTCHPGTRLKIGKKLFTWLNNPGREWDMIWLCGPAGTGKSAVAQTFAECCGEIGRLGASFFFSRSNDHNDPDAVVPSLVYHLAVCNSAYKALVAAQLANDPELLRKKTRRTQFKKLIVEPLSLLQIQGHRSVQQPSLVVLDGLDECKGEDAQRDIVEMINEVVRLKKDFPLVWLICSRPEPHLKYLFSRADFTIHCGREELAIDAESIADVDFYLRDGLAGIKAHFSDVTAPGWPPEEQITELSGRASGHFAFASTALRYIGSLTYMAPMSQLDALLSFLRGVRSGTSNPLEALDALYTAIFHDVPEDVLSTTKQLLAFFIFGDFRSTLQSAQGACNFLHIGQVTFYGAFRKLHSVIDVPSPEAALQMVPRFYHTSFEDYLCDPSRSGKFAIGRDGVDLSYAILCLSWYKTDLELFHTTDGPIFNGSHEHGILPGLSWASDDNRAEISCAVVREAERRCWRACYVPGEWDEALLSQIQNFDFRYIRTDVLDDDWRSSMNMLWKMNSSSGIIRTEPRTEVDDQLLGYMKSMVGPLWPSFPATFPLDFEPSHGGEYFFLGHGPKSVVCWTTGYNRWRYSVLNADEPPSEERIGTYQVQFEK